MDLCLNTYTSRCGRVGAMPVHARRGVVPSGFQRLTPFLCRKVKPRPIDRIAIRRILTRASVAYHT